MNVFMDTSAFYAILDRNDQHHPEARKIWEFVLMAEHHLITSNYVVIESCALIQSRLGLNAVRTFLDDMLSLVRTEMIEKDLHLSGLNALLSAGRRNLSLVDCVNFTFMRSIGLRVAFTFDKHFTEQGFDVITAPKRDGLPGKSASGPRSGD